jgi:hypothetical protein
MVKRVFALEDVDPWWIIGYTSEVTIFNDTIRVKLLNLQGRG